MGDLQLTHVTLLILEQSLWPSSNNKLQIFAKMMICKDSQSVNKLEVACKTRSCTITQPRHSGRAASCPRSGFMIAPRFIKMFFVVIH